MFFTIIGIIAAALILIVFFLLICSARALGGGWKFTDYDAEHPPRYLDDVP